VVVSKTLKFLPQVADTAIHGGHTSSGDRLDAVLEGIDPVENAGFVD
jgi:hypothetical protein